MAQGDEKVKELHACLNGEEYVGVDHRKAGGPAKIAGAQAMLRIDPGIDLTEPERVFVEGCVRDGIKKLEPTYGKLSEANPLSWKGNSLYVGLVMPTNASLFFSSAVCLGSVNGAIEKLMVVRGVKANEGE